jgi:mannose-6-phosphate isomerase
MCVVATGPLAGKSFEAVYRERGADLVGAEEARKERFPLLMKILFPREKLSVQVHPDDAMAREHGEPHGKTECWYALEAEPGAGVSLGLRPGTTTEQVRFAIEDHSLENLLGWLPVKKGDMVFVDAGTVHAVGPGVVLLETQQNSDMTYRLYDYGRPRELHLKDGLQAIRLKTAAGTVPREDHGNCSRLIQSRYFQVDLVELAANETRSFSPPQGDAVQLIFAGGGKGTLSAENAEPVVLSRGELAVVPACVSHWSMTASEPMEIVRAVPRSAQ